jgi:hypothetical protein
MWFDERKFKVKEEAKLLAPPPRSPAVTAIAQVFAALADRRAASRAALPETPPVADSGHFDPATFVEGTPLLDGVDPLAFRDDFLAAARGLVPAMAELFPAVAAELNTLAAALADAPALADACLAAASGDGEEAAGLWEKAASICGVSAPVVAFARTRS